jgi:Tol biopolymer transport system component
MRQKLAILVVAAIAAASLALAASSLGAAGSVLLVSEPNDPHAPSRPTEHFNPTISADGRFVAYVGTVSIAGSVEDISSIGETGTGIFLRDISGPTIPVDIPFGTSKQGLGFEAGAPSLSATGRFLAFATEDPDLNDEDLNNSTTLAGDTFPVRDIFVYDRSNGTISLVSRRDGPKGAAANSDSNLPSISADGRYVAFGTSATNFLKGVYGGVYVRDLQTNKTILAGRANGARGEPLHGASSPSISAHGRWVAFVTVGPRGRNPATPEIAVRDLKTKRTVFASRASGGHGALAVDDCAEPALSANGRYVAFASKAKNLSQIDKDSVEDIFVRDLETNRTVLVSRAKGKRGAAGSGDSSDPSISTSGRYVAFESYASNLGPADNGTIPDVFVRDLHSGRVFLASRGDGNGPTANAPSANPAISADGRFVAFDSRGSNLSAIDTLHLTSVFRYQLLP